MSKRLSKIEPLDINELFSSPSLEGMLSFREVDPAIAATRLRAKQDLDRSQGISGANQNPAPPPKPLEIIQPNKPSEAQPNIPTSDPEASGNSDGQANLQPFSDISGLAIPIGFTPIGAASSNPSENTDSQSATHPPQLPPSLSDNALLTTEDILNELKGEARLAPSRGKILRAHRMEDAHSNNENGLYWYLWRNGRQIRDSKSRFLQAGYAQLSKGVGLDRTNLQTLLRSLEGKLAIRFVSPATVKSPTVYEVYSCEQILTHRHEAGLVWVRRYGGRRVDFVDEFGNLFAPTGPTPPAPRPGMGIARTGTMSVKPADPVGVRPPLLEREELKLTTSTTHDHPTENDTISVIAKALQQYASVDDDAIRLLLRDVRRISPDATANEIAHFIHSKGLMVRTGRIQNPVGFFLASVPACFKGATFQAFRQQRSEEAARAEDEARRAQYEMEDFYHAQERILGDPNAPDDDKALARQILQIRDGAS